MAEQAIRTNKTSKIKALLFFLALAGIDAGMLLFAGVKVRLKQPA